MLRHCAVALTDNFSRNIFSKANLVPGGQVLELHESLGEFDCEEEVHDHPIPDWVQLVGFTDCVILKGHWTVV